MFDTEVTHSRSSCVPHKQQDFNKMLPDVYDDLTLAHLRLTQTSRACKKAGS